MLLVDTSVWIDHLRHEDPVLADLLKRERVLCHPLVIGEVAVGQLKARRAVVENLLELPEAVLADHSEVLQAIEHYALFGAGLSYVDACLLTSVKITPRGDRRMQTAARAMSIVTDPLH